MIASLNGRIIAKEPTFAVIECGGVGMRCFITDNTYRVLGSVGQPAFLYTYLSVREDALDLYGFADEQELEIFKMIITVSGVGSKIGLALLSEFTPDKLVLFIASGDSKALTAASGVGLKLAQRIILELKDKVGSAAIGQSAEVAVVGNAGAIPAAREAVEALVALGFTQSEASLAVGRLDPSLSVDELIKQALKSLSRGI